MPFDRVILGDLASDYAKQLDTQALSGTGASGQLRGYLSVTSGNTAVTYTNSTPSAIGAYQLLAELQGKVNASRFLPPDTVAMRPERWAWFCASVDQNNRPLIVPSANYNAIATVGDAAAEGRIGELLGMRCLVDSNIPNTLGAGSNEDVILVYRSQDLYLWESDIAAEAFDSPFADQAGVLFRVLGYAGLIVDRYPQSLGQLNGDGLVPPTYGS